MARARKRIENIDDMVLRGQKKFVRYDEGAVLYSMGINKFRDLAHEAGAVYKVKRCALVNCDIVNDYLENFKEDACL